MLLGMCCIPGTGFLCGGGAYDMVGCDADVQEGLSSHSPSHRGGSSGSMACVNCEYSNLDTEFSGALVWVKSWWPWVPNRTKVDEPRLSFISFFAMNFHAFLSRFPAGNRPPTSDIRDFRRNSAFHNLDCILLLGKPLLFPTVFRRFHCQAISVKISLTLS
jgi:hypothetical protein